MGCSFSTSGACQTSGRPLRLPVSWARVSPLSLSVRCSISFQACSGNLVLGDMVHTSDSHAEPLLVFAPVGLGCGAAQYLAGGFTWSRAVWRYEVLLRVIGAWPLPKSVAPPPWIAFKSSGVGATRCLYIMS